MTVPQVYLLTGLINQATFAKRDAESWGIPSSTYASTLNDCMRQQYYRRTDTQMSNVVERVPEWERNAQAGTSMHRDYQELFRRAGLVAPTSEVLAHAGYKLADFSPKVRKMGLPEFAEELPIPMNSYGVGGKCDMICRVTGDFALENSEYVRLVNELVVVEIKTVKDKYFKTVPNNFKWPGYYSQLELYMSFFKIKHGIVYMINRNDDETKELYIPYDGDYVQGRLARATALQSHIKDKTIPPMEPEFMRCKLCPWAATCDAYEMMESTNFYKDMDEAHWESILQ